MTEVTEQVRYGHRHNDRKNQPRCSMLITLKEGDNIFFGISKCHSELDTWNKAQADKYARVRANSALELSKSGRSAHWVTIGGVTVHQDGGLGHCNVSNIKDLLTYFNAVTAAKRLSDVTRAAVQEVSDETV